MAIPPSQARRLDCPTDRLADRIGRLRWLAPPLALFVLWLVAGPLPAVPRTASGLAPGVRTKLDQAVRLATARLEREPACRELFTSLGMAAGQALDLTLYAPAPARLELRQCRRGVSALTTVGGRVTYLCRDFRRLAGPEAATVVLHEALHLAGLPEAPATRGALLSAEINARVVDRCAL